MVLLKLPDARPAGNDWPVLLFLNFLVVFLTFLLYVDISLRSRFFFYFCRTLILTTIGNSSSNFKKPLLIRKKMQLKNLQGSSYVAILISERNFVTSFF